MESGQTVSLEVRAVPSSRIPTVAAEFDREFRGAGFLGIDYLEALERKQSVGLLGLEWSAGGNVWLLGPKTEARGAKASQIARALLAAADRHIEQRRVTFAQVLLDPAQSIEAGWYTDFGYGRVIRLEFLVRTISGNASPHVPAARLNCHSIPYTVEHHDRFLTTLIGSYRDSEDCLVLDGQGDPEEILSDYRGGSLFDPTLWHLLQSADEDVGCLLLRHHVDDASLEIVYLGLIPTFRGRGLGHWATCMAIAEAKRLGCRQLTVAVDTSNAAACGLYAHWGFICFARKRAQIRAFTSKSIEP